MNGEYRRKREEIIAKWDGMAPRERDAWVAEVVFGWTPRRLEKAQFAWNIGVSGVETIPYYTTDISAAWTVLEHMRSNGVYLNVHAARDDYYVLAFISAKTAQEAICLAALIARLRT